MFMVALLCPGAIAPLSSKLVYVMNTSTEKKGADKLLLVRHT